MSRVLIVDDEPAVRFAIEEALGEAGIEVVSASSAAEAMQRIDDVDVVLTDLAMPHEDGIALATRVREIDPDLPVILLTARGSERIAVAAMKAGVHDYLTKPFAIDELRAVIARAVETHRLRRAARDHAMERIGAQTPVGSGPAFRALVDRVRRAAARDITVLVRGETGTGKELVAAALHAQSARRDGPFVRFNCASIPAELAEAELFGHVRGAFTGASADRAGFFAQAQGGTLVLDEVGELPAAVQASLLRALSASEIQRVGASRVERVDVRVIACTHRDLRADADAGRFREDLYYRLSVVEIEVPPLRERREDLPALIDALRVRWCARFGIDDAHFTSELAGALAAREWPGNVRELENAIARILTLADPGDIGIEALQIETKNNTVSSLRAQMDAFERSILAAALEQCEGNQSEVARRLGVTRTTLLDKLKRHGLHKTY